ncbi:flavodoxin [Clostridium tertium]|uniref:Flavodoxin n=1 Tax=Clostridium tertium TaxID=1559 RepID=A0A9X3XJM0_9CLOT|nr:MULTISPECIES: flavodoxin [Clostridium]EEH97180.1 flavodoxin [Clostridium sp. 7_2_43FAA]MBP1867386.1 flavodoxin short chain [Clostridium tertium]MBU6134718.1 flavodoxin [Clostridium tertium]MDB1941251.1 flavodoxin [Clostridium tertium]MDB1948207.1 flavodoxin [Clostridium tertium]
MKIIYWSGTGNTEAMANLILEGVKEAGAVGELINISTTDVDSIANEEVVVLGCPCMGDEELEDGEFLPFLESIEGDLNGKKVALFGSYGWGSGEWMENFEEKIKDLGASLPLESLIVNYTPEGEDEERCREYGRQIAAL